MREKSNWLRQASFVVFCILFVAILAVLIPSEVRADDQLTYMELDSPDGIDKLMVEEKGMFLDQQFYVDTTLGYEVNIPERGVLIIKNQNSNSTVSTQKLYRNASKMTQVMQYNTNYSSEISPWLLDPGTYYLDVKSVARDGCSRHQWFAYFIPVSKAIQANLSYNTDHSSCTVTLSSPSQNHVSYSYHPGEMGIAAWAIYSGYTSISGKNTLDLKENGIYSIKATWSNSGTAWDVYPFVLDINIDGIGQATNVPDIPESKEPALPSITPSRPSTIEVPFPTFITQGTGQYKVKQDGKSVIATGFPSMKKSTSITIPATVKSKGKTYKVTEIASGAFKGFSKLKNVVIGKNVTKIGKAAFQNCKALKKVTIKSKVLKSIGKKAFAKAGAKNYKKLKVKVPAKKLEPYKKLLKKAGLSAKAKVKK